MDKNSYNEKGFIDPKKLSTLGFFSGDESLVFIFKKTEKIVAATYLVSGLIKDNEPIKWDLREKAVTMLSSSLSLNGIEPADKSLLIQTVLSVSVEIITLLNIGSCAGFISKMNHEILCREIEILISIIKERITEDVTRAGYVLSDTFFRVEQTAKLSSFSQPPTQPSVAPTLQTSDKNGEKMTEKRADGKPNGKKADEKKNERKKTILGMLSKGLPLTIKDFTLVISNCSEKTIQRELIDLVENGLILKEGERRWSKYSIKS